jgi:VWFA-related protein
VPLDVRVYDRRTNKPITDLRQDEFVILENNTRQQIQFFSSHALVADADAAAAPLNRAVVGPTTLGPQTRRTFLIVLGRGRLQPVTKAVDGLVHLVKNRLLPQDYVGVMAWNRATDFTTDHAKVAALLERYLKQHEKVEALMAQQFSGLGAQYGGGYIPKPIQSQIDAIFSGPGLPSVRTVPDAPTPNAQRIATDQNRVADALLRNEMNATREAGTFLTDPVDPSGGLGMSFDEYIEANAQSSQDMQKLLAGVNYMRFLDGEKHLLFISERGLMLPRAEDDRGIGAIAADARVAIDIMHTGGTSAAGLPTAARGGRGMMMAPAPMDWRASTARTVAEYTGGRFSSLMGGKDYMNKLDEDTRFSYLLGYRPTNTNWNGQFRRVNVVVRRPGVPLRVEYRHGYFANQQLTPLDKPRALTYSRVTGAANTAQDIPDIGLTVTAAHATGENGALAIDLVVKIRPEQLSFTEKDGKKVGAIDIAVFCADPKEVLVGESWNTVTLEMTPDAFTRFQTSGLNYSGKVPVRGAPRFVKVIVYDLGADVLGSQMLKLDPPKKK